MARLGFFTFLLLLSLLVVQGLPVGDTVTTSETPNQVSTEAQNSAPTPTTSPVPAENAKSASAQESPAPAKTQNPTPTQETAAPAETQNPAPTQEATAPAATQNPSPSQATPAPAETSSTTANTSASPSGVSNTQGQNQTTNSSNENTKPKLTEEERLARRTWVMAVIQQVIDPRDLQIAFQENMDGMSEKDPRYPETHPKTFAISNTLRAYGLTEDDFNLVNNK